MRKIAAKVSEAFSENPIGWIVFGLLVFSVYSHYRTGSHFTTVCTDIADTTREIPNAVLADWQKAELREIENLCGDRASD
jgi:hypothetical protein